MAKKSLRTGTNICVKHCRFPTSLLILQTGLGVNERDAEHNTPVSTELSERGKLVVVARVFSGKTALSLVIDMTIFIMKHLT